MHSVGKNSLIYAQLSTLAWAACGWTSWLWNRLGSLCIMSTMSTKPFSLKTHWISLMTSPGALQRASSGTWTMTTQQSQIRALLHQTTESLQVIYWQTWEKQSKPLCPSTSTPSLRAWVTSFFCQCSWNSKSSCRTTLSWFGRMKERTEGWSSGLLSCGYHNGPGQAAGCCPLCESSSKSPSNNRVELWCRKALRKIFGKCIGPQGMQLYNPAQQMTPGQKMFSLKRDWCVAAVSRLVAFSECSPPLPSPSQSIWWRSFRALGCQLVLLLGAVQGPDADFAVSHCTSTIFLKLAERN